MKKTETAEKWREKKKMAKTMALASIESGNGVVMNGGMTNMAAGVMAIA